jgi:malate synthase
MAAFIPSRRDAAVNATALEKVREDKRRESGDGFDGTWVAHPDLVSIADEMFTGVLGDRPHQKGRQHDDVRLGARELLDLHVEGGRITRAGVDTNVDVALRYLEAWLRGQGAVAIHNLMEDAATAEISRSQLWQWIRNRAPLAGGGTVTAELYEETRTHALAELQRTGHDGTHWAEAGALLDELVLGDFQEFLTEPGYRLLHAGEH